jgi:hypothetical protein
MLGTTASFPATNGHVEDDRVEVTPLDPVAQESVTQVTDAAPLGDRPLETEMSSAWIEVESALAE